MDFTNYNSLAMHTANKNLDWMDTLVNASMGLAGESAEVIEHVKKAKFHGHAIDAEKVALELGDCLYYINWLADTLGYDLEEIASKNIEKLRKRYGEKFDAEASQNRVEYKTKEGYPDYQNFYSLQDANWVADTPDFKYQNWDNN